MLQSPVVDGGWPVSVLRHRYFTTGCRSYSKNLGLYAERVGAFTYVGTDAETTKKVGSTD